jgi:TonB family protein
MSQRNVTSTQRSGTFSDGHSGWTDGVSHWLIHHAACRAPGSLAQRLEEEWLADSAARSGAMSRLRLALGCCWATRVIAYEHQPSSVPVTSSVMEAKLMIGYAQHDFGYFSRRSGTLFLVVSLHALIFYGLVTAVLHPGDKVNTDPLQNQALNQTPSRVLPVPLAKPQLLSMTIEMPKPAVAIPQESDASSELTARFVEEPSTSTTPAAAHLVKQVQGGPGAGFPNPDDFYPALARFKEEQGVATVRVCVDANGRLTADPTTLQGSGSARLDEGALKLARAGSGHYRASTEDGQPVNSCYPLRIRFQLKG